MSNTPTLDIPEMDAAQSQPHLIVNFAIRILEAVGQLVVASRTTTVPPGSPADGARYIVPEGASAPWNLHPNEIAIYMGGGWQYAPALPGWLAYVTDASETVQMAAGSPRTWATFAGGGGGGGPTTAADVSYTAAGSPSNLTVQAALDQLFVAIAALGSGGASAASDISYAAAGSPTQITVQEALDQLFASFVSATTIASAVDYTASGSPTHITVQQALDIIFAAIAAGVSLSAANVWTNTNQFNSSVTLVGAIFQTNMVAVSLSSGNNNDFDLGTAAATGARISPDDTLGSTLTGIASPTLKQRMTIFNISASATGILTLAHQNAGSIGSSRIICPGLANFAIGPGGAVDLWYDSLVFRWRVISN